MADILEATSNLQMAKMAKTEGANVSRLNLKHQFTRRVNGENEIVEGIIQDIVISETETHHIMIVVVLDNERTKKTWIVETKCKKLDGCDVDITSLHCTPNILM